MWNAKVALRTTLIAVPLAISSLLVIYCLFEAFR
jgi:hypothetical protein